MTPSQTANGRRSKSVACSAAAFFGSGKVAVSEEPHRVEDTGERWFEAELHRRKGEILLRLHPSDPSEAEASFRRALAVAQQQDAKFWELRAATAVARLWRDLGRCTDAHDLLAPFYGWFKEGFDTADLIEAKALLDELA